MQITQAQVGNVIYSLAEGQPLPVAVGDTLKVFYAFKYKMPEEADVRIWVSLYYYTLLGFFEREEKAQRKETITLEKSLEWKLYEGEIDIVIGDIVSDTYGLICELPDYDVEHRIEDCLEVTAPPSMMEMMGPLLVMGLMMGMMAMMAPMMEEGFG